MHTHTSSYAVAVHLGLGSIFVCLPSFLTRPVCVAISFFCVFCIFTYFLWVHLLVITSASDCLERLVSQMTYRVNWYLKFYIFTQVSNIWWKIMCKIAPKYMLKCTVSYSIRKSQYWVQSIVRRDLGREFPTVVPVMQSAPPWSLVQHSRWCRQTSVLSHSARDTFGILYLVLTFGEALENTSVSVCYVFMLCVSIGWCVNVPRCLSLLYVEWQPFWRALNSYIFN